LPVRAGTNRIRQYSTNQDIAVLHQALLTVLLVASLSASAQTYKCLQGGKPVFSDIPCAGDASRVDEHSDGVSRDQRRQAEIVNQKNSSQLSELEYNAARNRYNRGGVQVLQGDATDPATSRTYRSR